MDRSEFFISDSEGVAIVRLPEVVDEARAIEFAEKLGDLEQDGRLNVVIDCEVLHLISSTPIGHLIHLISRATGAGGRITMASLPESVERVFWAIRLNQLLETYATVEEAVKSYRS
ncbi:MAG TPA: STAS domain-containing protein [bacterium]|nr:STAS domain-containing protein [bacterium]HQO33772.1 STAS domain-containing protein [bacterium]HQP99116.1 STAS domain-containing protein [bacterium]